MAKPSLALIPSGYADNKVFSVLPSNGDGDFNFTRGSTATRVNAQGLIENVAIDVPRLNYPLLDGVVQECPSLLLEPQSINVLNYSEQFDNAYWINNGVTITANNSISPDGTQNADLLTGASGGFGVVRFSTWTSTNKTASCFAKKGSSNLFKIANVSGGVGGVTFNLDSGIVTNTDSGFEGSIENFGNGWYRCTATDTSARSGTFSLGVTAASESVYIWGAMLEAQTYSTSYIPTTTQAVTRFAETCNGAGTSDTFNDAEGVLMAEIADFDNVGFRQLTLSSGSNANAISIMQTTTENQILCFVNNGGITQVSISTFVSDTKSYNKIAFKYKENDFSVYINGFEIDTDTNGTVPSGLNRLSFDNNTTSSRWYGNCKDVRVYKTALQNSELETLTTWTSFTDMANGQLYTIQ